MKNVVVVSRKEDWPITTADVEVVLDWEYLTSARWSEEPRLRVYNLCRSLRYQRSGYYVSLLAEARGHQPLPDIGTVQDLKSPTVLRTVGEEIEELTNKSLANLASEEFSLSIYFGHNVAARHERLAQALFRRFRAPLLRAKFGRDPRDREWRLVSIGAIGISDVPDSHRKFVDETADAFFRARPRASRATTTGGRFDLAILADPAEEEPPSNERALKKFHKAATQVGFDVEFVERTDFSRLAEFDALFIRETTSVNHHTFRFSRKADALGLVVIDDPGSILRCTNKVFLAEALTRHKIPAPKTLVIHRGQVEEIAAPLGFPLVLKEPDSAFSKGVKKVNDQDELSEVAETMLKSSELIIAQEFLPTDYDWRIGIIDRTPIYACRYRMAQNHWQIIQRDATGQVSSEGAAETLPIEMAPSRVVKTAMRAANLMGDGLYGVDLKQVGDKVFVIEVNDNPSIDAGFEDAVLKDEIYNTIMRVFLARVERMKRGGRL